MTWLRRRIAYRWSQYLTTLVITLSIIVVVSIWDKIARFWGLIGIVDVARRKVCSDWAGCLGMVKASSFQAH